MPISQSEGTFLPLTGGTMGGSINMSGNTITNMAAVPAMPNGAAPAQWVLNQIASVSLYQGTWDADTNTPDLTQLSTHVNAYTWIAITTSVSGVVIGAAIPGLQGLTVFNGDTIIYSTAQGAFSAIHAGGITLPEADARYVMLTGSQMSGALLLNANATQNMQAVTFQQLEAAVANTVTPDAPADGQAYLRVGVGTNRWVPGLPLAGGILTGALTLAGPGASGNNAVTVAQMNSAITAGTAGLLPIAGGTMTGPIVLAGNATTNLNPVPLQQLNSMLGTYLPLTGGTLSGTLVVGSGGGANAQLSGGTASADALMLSRGPGGIGSGGCLVLGGPGNTNMPNGAYITVGPTGSTVSYLFAQNGTFSAQGISTVGNSSVSGWQQISGSNTGTSAGYGLVCLNSNIEVSQSANVNATLALSQPSGVWDLIAGGGNTFFILAGATQCMSMTPPGNMTIGGTLTQGSDETNKTNINPIGQGTSLVRQLIPKSFAWNSEPDVEHWGFIAQDVQSVIPDAVITVAAMDGTKSLALDVTAIIAAVTITAKQLDQRCTALEAAAGITPPADALA